MSLSVRLFSRRNFFPLIDAMFTFFRIFIINNHNLITFCLSSLKMETKKSNKSCVFNANIPMQKKIIWIIKSVTHIYNQQSITRLNDALMRWEKKLLQIFRVFIWFNGLEKKWCSEGRQRQQANAELNFQRLLTQKLNAVDVIV